MKIKMMLRTYIVSVLSYYDSQVDIFRVSVPDTISEEDEQEYLEGEVENRGHHLEASHWMFSDPNKFQVKVDL